MTGAAAPHLPRDAATALWKGSRALLGGAASVAVAHFAAALDAAGERYVRTSCHERGLRAAYALCTFFSKHQGNDFNPMIEHSKAGSSEYYRLQEESSYPLVQVRWDTLVRGILRSPVTRSAT